MRKVRRTHTAPEVLMQKALTESRVAFITHAIILGSKPDIILEKRRIAIFVDGDFWHGRIVHEQGQKALKRSLRSSSSTYWYKKINKNIDRDTRQTNRLRRHGWSVFRFWASDIIKNANTFAGLVVRRARQRRHIRANTRTNAA